MSDSKIPVLGRQTQRRNHTNDQWLSVINKVIENVAMKLKRREIRGSSSCSVQIADLLRTIIKEGEFNTVQEILDLIRTVGKRLASVHPIEVAIGNIVRRVLMIIRREALALSKEQSGDHKEIDDSQVEKLEFSRQLSSILDDDHHLAQTETKSNANTQDPIIPQLCSLLESGIFCPKVPTMLIA